jgi:hypothetical protein
LSFALLHYAAYAALRVPPYLWYYTPEVTGLTLAGGLGLAAAQRRARLRGQRRLAAALWLVALLPVLGLATSFVRARAATLSEMPLHSNWATRGQYEQIARELRARAPAEVPIRTTGEIGTLAYDSELRLENEFSDRRILMEMIEQVLKPRGWRRVFLRFNYFWLTPPGPPQSCTTSLDYEPGLMAPQGDVLRAWAVDTRWMGEGEFVWRRLTPAAPARLSGAE